MRRWSRRGFLGAVAAVCVGCTDDGDESAVTTSSRPPGPSSSAPSASDALGIGGFEVGTVAELRVELESGARYVPEVRAFLARFPADALDEALDAYDARLHDGLRAGFVGVDQRCPHLGCRVPYCESSGWFECPCHAGWFNGVGEYQSGLPERGLDLLPVRIVDDLVILERGPRVTGRPVDGGVVTSGPVGPHCFTAPESS